MDLNPALFAEFMDGGENERNNILNFMLNELMEPLPELDELEVRQRGQKARNQNYYEVIIPQYDDILFKEHFRMSRATFEVYYYITELSFLKISYKQISLF